MEDHSLNLKKMGVDIIGGVVRIFVIWMHHPDKRVCFTYSIHNSVKPEKSVDFFIRKAWQKILRMYNLEAAKEGTTMSLGYILLNIDKEGTPSTQLGPKIGIEKSSLSRTLKQMEEAGLIYRKTDQRDRRITRIYLTPFGVSKRKVARSAVLTFNNRVLEGISPEKLAIFKEVIGQITDIAMSYEGEKQDQVAS